MVSRNDQIKWIGHRFTWTILILVILSTDVCNSQAGARPKTTQSTFSNEPRENIHAVVARFINIENRKYFDKDERIYKRYDPVSNIRHLLIELHGTNLTSQTDDRPSIPRLESLKGLVLATASYWYYDESNARKDYSDTENVILPIERGRTELICVGFDGIAKFTTPYLTPYVLKGKIRLFRDTVTLEEDDKNNTYVFLPLKNNEKNIYMRTQFWVITSQRFANKITKEHLFHQHGYYMIPRTDVPEWLRMNAHYNRHIVPQRAGSSMQSTPIIYELAVYWTPGDCAHNIGNLYWVDKEICDGEGRYVIHGLFQAEKSPNYDYNKMMCYYNIVSQTQTHLNLRNWRDQRLINELRIWWPVVRVDITTEQWWEIEWCVHGKYMFRHPEEYFRTALELLHRSGINQPFSPEEPAFPNNDRIVSFDDILESIESRITRKVDLYCYATSYYYAVISQVMICFNELRQVTNCEIKSEKSCEVNDRFTDVTRTIIGIHHMPRYQLITHVILTLVLAQTQKQRLSTPRRNAQHRDWKIHKLCPNFKMTHIMSRYRRERDHCKLNVIAFLSSNRLFQQNRDYITEIWPSLEFETYDDGFWISMWLSCGFNMLILKDPKIQDAWQYIDTTVSLFNELKSNDWRFPTGTYSVDNFHQRLHQQSRLAMGLEIPPYHAILVCTNIKGKTHLVKIRLCYSLDFQFIPCPPSEVEFERDTIKYKRAPVPYVNCGNQFIINENYESRRR